MDAREIWKRLLGAGLIVAAVALCVWLGMLFFLPAKIASLEVVLLGRLTIYRWRQLALALIILTLLYGVFFRSRRAVSIVAVYAVSMVGLPVVFYVSLFLRFSPFGGIFHQIMAVFLLPAFGGIRPLPSVVTLLVIFGAALCCLRYIRNNPKL